MNQLRFVHIGDIHNDLAYLPKIKLALEPILKYCNEVKVNAVVIPGDVWHKRQSYSNSSSVPFFIDYLRKLSKVVDFIFITKGNHDDVGSIALLHQIESNIFAFEYPVCLAVYVREDTVVDLLRGEPHPDLSIDYIVSLVPYPSKASLLTDDSIDNNNANFIEKFEQIFEHIGEVTKEYNCPKILGFHGNVVGSRLSSGQTLVSQDIMVAPSTLEKAKHDYYALNHIHLRQEIKLTMIYAGGIANFNWGETEQKSFEVLDFVNGYLNIETIPLEVARPMIKLEAEFVDGEFVLPEQNDISIPLSFKAEFRLRCAVKENERSLITEEKIQQLKDIYGDDVKIEFNIVPIERSARSESIMTARDLLQEVIEYAKIIEHKVDNGVMTKVVELQEKGVAI